MNLRITPLNFATAFFLVLAFIVWLYKPISLTGNNFKAMTGTIALIYIVFAVMLSFLDMIFRNFFFRMKQLWIIELSFIVLTVILFLIVK